MGKNALWTTDSMGFFALVADCLDKPFCRKSIDCGAIQSGTLPAA